MKLKINIIKFCIGIISAFIAISVPLVCFVVPFAAAISETLWFLLFYIVTLPLAFIWYSFIPKGWKKIKENIIEDLLDMISEERK